MKVTAIATILVLVLTLSLLTILHAQFAFARVVITPGLWGIQSINSSGYVLCNPNCHLYNDRDSGNSTVEPAYRLKVNVPSNPFRTSAVDISITTANGYTDQGDGLIPGGSSYTFNIPKNQGNSVQVCVNSGILSHDNCRTYETTGNDMSVSLPTASHSDESN